MAKKYKQIQINDLSKGSALDYFKDEKLEEIKTSAGLIPDHKNNRLKLAPDYFEIEVDDSVQSNVGTPVSAVYPFGTGQRVYHLIFNSVSSRVEIYTQIVYSVIAGPSFQFGTNTDECYMLVPFRNLLISFYNDSVLGKRQSYSSSPTTSWSEQSWAYGEVRGYKITELNELYVYTDNKILLTTDGITWTVFYDFSDLELEIKDFDELDGILYVMLADDSGLSYLMKFDNTPEPFIIRELNSRTPATMKVFDNRVIVVTNTTTRITIFEWTKSDFREVAFMDKVTTSLRLFIADTNFLTLMVNSTEIISMNKNNALYYIKDFSYILYGAFIFNGNLCFSGFADTVFYSLCHRNDSSAIYQTTGNFVTPQLDPGLQMPTYLILKHAPLGDDAAIVIKAKIDQGSTFSKTLITNTTNDSVRTAVPLRGIFSDGELTYLQLEVTLTDSSASGEAKDIEVIYLYIPLGIENSQ